MKRILAVLSAFVLVFATACSGGNPHPGDSSGGASFVSVFEDPIRIPDPPANAGVDIDRELALKIRRITRWDGEHGKAPDEATALIQTSYHDINGNLLATWVTEDDGKPGSRAEITIYTPVEDIPAGSVIEAVIPEVEPPALPSYTPVYSFEGTPLSEEQDTALDQLFMTSAKVYRARRTTSRYTDMEYDGIVYSSWYHETMELTSTSTSALDYFQSYHKIKTTPGIDGMTCIEVYTENQTNICVITGGDYAGTYSVPLEILLQG